MQQCVAVRVHCARQQCRVAIDELLELRGPPKTCFTDDPPHVGLQRLHLRSVSLALLHLLVLLAVLSLFALFTWPIRTDRAVTPIRGLQSSAARLFT